MEQVYLSIHSMMQSKRRTSGPRPWLLFRMLILSAAAREAGCKMAEAGLLKAWPNTNTSLNSQKRSLLCISNQKSCDQWQDVRTPPPRRLTRMNDARGHVVEIPITPRAMST